MKFLMVLTGVFVQVGWFVVVVIDLSCKLEVSLSQQMSRCFWLTASCENAFLVAADSCVSYENRSLVIRLRQIIIF